MKKLALVSVCVLSLALAGSVVASNTMLNQAPVKKEAPAKSENAAAPAAKKDVKKAPVKKTTTAKKVVKKTDTKTATPEQK